MAIVAAFGQKGETMGLNLHPPTNHLPQTGKGEPNLSIESGKAFMEKLRDDEDFRNSMGEIGTAGERLDYELPVRCQSR